MRTNLRRTGALALALTISTVFAEKDKGYTYLALGDSIAFGFDPTLFLPPPAPLPVPGDFTGYPEVEAGLLGGKTHVNAACPGETSGSFIIVGAPDNGCNGRGPQGQPPFKTSIGLHAAYEANQSQLEFAIQEIRTNKSIKLVTLGIGGNDLALLQAHCLAAGSVYVIYVKCVSDNLPSVLASYGGNLALILWRLREGANYSGILVLVNYYSPNADPLTTGAISALNTTMAAVGAQFGVTIADAFGAFQSASVRANGDPCAARLLIPLTTPGPNGACDIHPSESGRKLLARVILAAVD